MSLKARALVQPTCKASSSLHSNWGRGLRVQRSDKPPEQDHQNSARSGGPAALLDGNFRPDCPGARQTVEANERHAEVEFDPEARWTGQRTSQPDSNRWRN